MGNLGDSIQEADLHGIFGELVGFRQLKLVRSGRNFTCFVEFSDIPSATAAKGRLHGCIVTGCGRGGIRIQYSKNPFGKKRGGNGWDSMGITLQEAPQGVLNGVTNVTNGVH